MPMLCRNTFEQALFCRLWFVLHSDGTLQHSHKRSLSVCMHASKMPVSSILAAENLPRLMFLHADSHQIGNSS